MDLVDQIQQIIDQMTSGIDAAGVNALAGCLKSLEANCAKTPQALYVIKMMHSVTNYLDARKHTAHPDTLPALGTLAGHLKSLLISPAGENQARILSESKQTFKVLKSAIESGKLVTDSEMEELKAVILSVDWEISNITMKGFDRVLTRLEKRLKPRKIHHTFLRIMHQIGAHIARRKSNAHQDSVFLLRRVFQHYELLVAHPDMAPFKQKALVQASIREYNTFKRKVDAGLAHDHLPDDSGDNNVAPALSHIEENASNGQDGLFFALKDPMTDPAYRTGRTAKATLSLKDDSLPPQRDVMEDLFSMKESPADQLLDAIHLSNMHGPDQQTAAAIPGLMNGDDKKAGVQQVTAQREDKVPIPEIERRLDEFFNLEPCAANKSDDRDLPGSLDTGHKNLEHQEPDHEKVQVREPPPDLLDLKDLLCAPGTLSRPDLFDQVQKKINRLNGIWDPKSDKANLLGIVSALARFIHQQALHDTERNGLDKGTESSADMGGMETAHAKDSEIPETNKNKKGFLARLKARFKKEVP